MSPAGGPLLATCLGRGTEGAKKLSPHSFRSPEFPSRRALSYEWQPAFKAFRHEPGRTRAQCSSNCLCRRGPCPSVRNTRLELSRAYSGSVCSTSPRVSGFAKMVLLCEGGWGDGILSIVVSFDFCYLLKHSVLDCSMFRMVVFLIRLIFLGCILSDFWRRG